ncbi:hypothetical protein H1R20_g922, partial [Candolleomyces eurysporus]
MASFAATTSETILTSPDEITTPEFRLVVNSPTPTSSVGASKSEVDIAAIADELMKGRISCRYFLPREVSRSTIEEIIEVARFAPSGNNIQPWQKVYCLTGDKLAVVKEALLTAFVNEPEKHASQYEYYPPLELMPQPYAERRQEFGRMVGQALGIERSDREGRLKAAGSNYQFYNAPVALVVTIHKGLRQGSWLDVGYFLQSISIAACARGLATVTQESITRYQSVLRRQLPIGDDEIVAVGMSMGYPDAELVSRYALPRERREVSDIISFHHT